MQSNIHKALSAAMLRLLRPLVRILLRNDFAYGSFNELVKKAYADVAYAEFTVPGKKQTVSKVSALTGLTRKEAKRLLDINDPDDLGATERYNRSVRVLSGWQHDKTFLDEQGNAAVLEFDGEPSFSSLVKKYSGDITAKAMLSVFIESESVKVRDDKVQLLKNAYVPGKDPVDKVIILGSDAAELIATIDHNLTHEDVQLRYQRKVSNHAVPVKFVPEFKALASGKAQGVLEELDRWLSDRTFSCADQGKSSETQFVSMGIYYYQEDMKKEEKE